MHNELLDGKSGVVNLVLAAPRVVTMERKNLVFVTLLLSGIALGHHGPPNRVLYDMDDIVEIAGPVTEIFWRNPHVRFRMRDATGEVWEVESGPVTWLSRLGWTEDIVSIGDRVRVAGYVSQRRTNEMALTNMLLPNGLEFTGSSRPRELRFSDRRVEVVREGIDESKREEAIRNARSLFRVWAWGVGEFGGGGTPDNNPEMLTTSARAARDAFDLLTDEPVLECIQDGMPRAMFHPTVLEFTDGGSQLTLRSHEHDIVRTINMEPAPDPASQPAGPLGYSVGRWDSETLMVTTTRVDWPLSDEAGTPQSPDVRLVERFTPTPDGSRLDYDLTAFDPANLTGPSVRTAHWMWVPGLEVAPYDCAVWEE